MITFFIAALAWLALVATVVFSLWAFWAERRSTRRVPERRRTKAQSDFAGLGNWVYKGVERRKPR